MSPRRTFPCQHLGCERSAPASGNYCEEHMLLHYPGQALEREQAERARQVEAARFHRQVERAAVVAFGELLRQLGEEHDLMFIEPDVMERLGKRAWDWGLVFAESRKPE